jgi:hypothetical protein
MKVSVKGKHFGLLVILAFLILILMAANVEAREDEIEMWASTTNARDATWAYIGETSVVLMFFPAQNATDVSVEVTDCPMFTSEVHVTVPHIDADVRWPHELFFDIEAEPGNFTIKIAISYTDDQGGTVEHTVDHPFEVIRAIEIRSLTISDDEWNFIRVEVETFVFLDVLGIMFDANPDLVFTNPQESLRDVDPGVYKFSTRPREDFGFEGDYSVQVRLGGAANYHSFTIMNQTVDITIEEETDPMDPIVLVTLVAIVAILIIFLVRSIRFRKSTGQ